MIRRFNAVGPHGLVYIQYQAQRWTALKDTGPSPCGRRGHTMTSDGGRVFVLGGDLSAGAQVDEAKLIHVLDTSMYFLFVVLFGQRSSLKQSSSITQSPRVNHNTGYSLHPMLEQRTAPFLSKYLLSKTWASRPYRRFLVIETPI